MAIEIIAEIAQGFEGYPEQSRLLLKAAAVAGADAAKYQLVYADELATPDYKYYELFKSLEMSDEVWIGLASDAEALKIQLHLDIFGERSLQLAERLGVAAVKLHGTDIANVGLLEAVKKSQIQKILLGAGGAYLGEIKQALEILSNKSVVVLLGFQGYPTPTDTNQIARVNLLIDELRRDYPAVSIGFADHALPESPLRYALAAVAMGAGATVFEKHITLGKVMKLEDHESALNPDEFLEFTQVIRQSYEALGSSQKSEQFGMSEAEQNYRKMIRRHVVSCQNISKNTNISPAELVLKRTSAEDALTDLTLVYGKKVRRDISQNKPVLLTDIIK